MTTQTRNDSKKLITQHPLPERLGAHLNFWQSKDISSTSIVLSLPDICIDELHSELRATSSGNTPNNSDNDLPGCREFIHELQHRLNHVSGCVILDRFPTERYNDEENRRLAALFCSRISPLQPQDYNGTLVYDVIDKKPQTTAKVRKSVTNLAQPYHSDGPWYNPTAHYVGLYCIQNAREGGRSRVTSLALAYHTFYQAADSAVLKILCNPLPWDRQGEHSASDKTFTELPVFELSKTAFVGRYYKNYIHNGFKEMGRPVDESTVHALSRLDETLLAQKKIDFVLEPGQLQIINNWTVLHARDAFSDEPESASSRQMIRLWNR